MKPSRIMKWITGAVEMLLGIPLLGAAIVIGSVFTVLGVMLILHIATLILSVRDQEPTYGSILGIITSCIAWIPFVGMTMHIITGILLIISASKSSMHRPHNHTNTI